MTDTIEMESTNHQDKSALVESDKAISNGRPCCDNLALVLPSYETRLEATKEKNDLQTVPHLEAPKISNLNCSSCNDVQIGTRIITSNLTVQGDGRITVQHLGGDKDSSGKSEKVFVLNKWIQWFVCALLIFLGVLTYFVFRLGDAIKGGNYEISTTNLPISNVSMVTTTPSQITMTTQTSTLYSPTHYYTTSTKPSWLITRNQWGSQHVNCTPDLGVVTTLKLVSGFDCGSLSCSAKIKKTQQSAFALGKKDVEFHFAVNDKGAAYEGRVFNCQTEKEYRDCNRSLLIVRIYRIDEDEDPWYDDHANKIISSLDDLVSYGQDEAFIYGHSRDDVVFELAHYWSKQYFTKNLKAHFKNITFYQHDYNRFC